MIALFRIALKKRTAENESNDILAGFLLALTMLTLLAPKGFHILSKSSYGIHVSFKNIIWIAGLSFLVNYARLHKNDKDATVEE